MHLFYYFFNIHHYTDLEDVNKRKTQELEKFKI